MALAPVTRVWGEAEIRRGRPRVERFRDVLFTPYRWGESWGVFDRQGRIIEATVDRRYPDAQTIDQLTTSPLAYDEVEQSAPPFDYIYVGRFEGHFGHFLVETLPRYWALTRGVRRGQKLLVHSISAFNFFEGFDFAQDIFRALRIAPADFFWSANPMRVAQLTVPHPSLRQQAWAHPEFGALCRTIGRRLLAGGRVRRGGRPVWLSKSRLTTGVGRIRNEARLEVVLASAGVEIVHPETMPLAAQIRLFAERPAVLGTSGSGFHVAAFAPPGARLIGLCLDDAVNANFPLFDRLSGRTMERWHEPGATTTRPLQADFLIETTLADPEGVARALLDRL